MKCPTCGQRTKLLNSGPVACGYMIRRSRQCKHGHKFNTYEVDDTLDRSIFKYGRDKRRIDGFIKAAKRFARDMKIVSQIKKGEKFICIAAEFGVSPTRVIHIARREGLPCRKAANAAKFRRVA